MPNLDPVKIPADAFEKATAKSEDKDFYADLTDEERAEEGLPPRETPKVEEEKPAAEKPEKPEPEKKDDPAKADVPGDDADDEEDEDDDRLFREVAGLREDLAASLKKPEPAAPEKPKIDPRIQELLESDDPRDHLLAESLQKNAELEERLAAQEGATRAQMTERQLAKDDAEFEAVQSSYLVGNEPMTDKHVEQIEDWIIANPELGSRLSIEQVARVVFPDAARRPKSASAKRPADSANGNGSSVATIVDTGAGSGGTNAKPWKPRPNETIESAMAEAGKRLFGLKR